MLNNEMVDYQAIYNRLYDKYRVPHSTSSETCPEINELGQIYTSHELEAGMLLDLGISIFTNDSSERVNNLRLQLVHLLSSEYEYGEYEIDFVLSYNLWFDYGWSLHFESVRSFLQYLIFCTEDYLSLQKNKRINTAVNNLEIDYLKMSNVVWNKYLSQETELQDKYPSIRELGDCYSRGDNKVLLDTGFRTFTELHAERVQSLPSELRILLETEYEYGDYELSYVLSRYLSFGYGWKAHFESPKSLIRYFISSAEHYIKLSSGSISK
jgi:hypothetical protein